MPHHFPKCPICQEPHEPPAIPLRCPSLGGVACPLDTGPDPATKRQELDDTIALTSEMDVEEQDSSELSFELASESDDDGFPAQEDLTGRPLGQYLMGPLLGRGTMGRVYRAEHLGLARPCAIKVMNPGLLTRQPEVLEHFWAEARAIAGLIHPHIVTVHNLGSDRGYHYIEMEYVQGGTTLGEEVIRRGPMEPLRVTSILHQVTLALDAAHRAHLVHRDVKPSNVLLQAGDHAKLADFGLVRRRDDGRHINVAGTPAYMAPELFRGVPAGPCSDIYSTGVMFYYLLTAKLPLASDNVAQLLKLHRTSKIPDVRQRAPSVPEEVASVVHRCLEFRPSDRYQAADELADDLQNLLFQYHDTRSIVRECLEGLDARVEGGPDQFRVHFELPGDRKQEVQLWIDDGHRGRRLVSVYSVCGPAEADHYEFALRLNADLTRGSLSVLDIDDRPMFVMTRNFEQGRASVNEIREALLEIARRSDWVEHQLTNADHY